MSSQHSKVSRPKGLPSSLNRLTRQTNSVGEQYNNTSMNTCNAEVSPFVSRLSHVSPESDCSLLGSDTINTSLKNLIKDNFCSEKISIDITTSEHKRRTWCHEIESLKMQSKMVKDKPVIVRKDCAPFANFRARRPNSKGAHQQPTFQTLKARTNSNVIAHNSSNEPTHSQALVQQPLPHTIIAREKYKPVDNVPTSFVDLHPFSDKMRMVRFKDIEENNMAFEETSVTTDTTHNSTLSDLKRIPHAKSLQREISCHRCPRNPKGSQEQFNKKLHWSNYELTAVRGNSLQSIRKFQSKHPGTVLQIVRLFEDFCSSNNKKNEEYYDEVDEENEEMLREFLQHWSSSGMRGLEEGVTDRQMLREDRNMAVESVLTYQERLRTQERNRRLFSLHPTTPEEDAKAMEDQTELLRARSESTSHRARMFAMYMALGDALFVANEEQCLLSE